MYNALPVEIKRYEKIEQFKCELKEYFCLL